MAEPRGTAILLAGAVAVAQAATAGAPHTATCPAPPLSSDPLERPAPKARGDDCSLLETRPRPAYERGVLYEIPFVVHLIQAREPLSDSELSPQVGILDDDTVAAQVRTLNEDFLALRGAPGEVDVGIRFRLEAVTRTVNPAWFTEPTSDPCPYCDALGWDPRRVVNVYVNRLPGGAIGRVWAVPQDPGRANRPLDRIVVDSRFFAGGEHTLAHEFGHFLGLLHTFSDRSLTATGCGDPEPPGCYRTGDLICDTAPDHAQRQFGGGRCEFTTPCGVRPPIENYMSSSPRGCASRFTAEQANRMRCVLESYRPHFAQPAELPPPTAPAGLRATVEGDRIVLRWQDRSPDETGFRVDRRIDEEPFQPLAEVGAGVTRLVDTDVAFGHRYRYRVTALRAGEESPPSPIAEASLSPRFTIERRPLTAAEISALLPCEGSTTVACLHSGRFRVAGEYWNAQRPEPRPITLRRFSDLSVELFFADPGNIELVYRILDGCTSQGSRAFWLFGGGATDQGFEIRFADLEGGLLYALHNDLGSLPPPITDTAAFAICGGGP